MYVDPTYECTYTIEDPDGPYPWMRWEANWGSPMPSTVVSAAELMEAEHPTSYRLYFTVVPDQLCSRISVACLLDQGWQITRDGVSGPKLRLPGGRLHYLSTEATVGHGRTDTYIDFVIVPPSPYRPGGATIFDTDNPWQLGRRRYSCLLDWSARFSTMVARDSSILDYERHGDLGRFLTVVPAAPTMLEAAHAPWHWNCESPLQLMEPSGPPDLLGPEQQRWGGRSADTADNPSTHAHPPGASTAHPITHDHIDDSRLAAAAPQTDVAGA